LNRPIFFFAGSSAKVWKTIWRRRHQARDTVGSFGKNDVNVSYLANREGWVMSG